MRAVGSLVCLLALTGCSRNAPPWTTVEAAAALELLGSEGGVAMARLRLGASETFRFEAGPCQEVLVLVERGTARVSLEWIEAGRAARFRAPAVLQAMSEDGVEAFVVAALTEGAPSAAPDWGGIPDDRCRGGEPAIVLSDPSRSGPFVRAERRLEVMIYLDDADDAGAAASLGTLQGTPELGVPEHVHAQSAETLFIVRGSGTMRRGEVTIPIVAGTFVHVPPGTVHGFTPDGASALFAYQVYTPPGPEQRFR